MPHKKYGIKFVPDKSIIESLVNSQEFKDSHEGYGFTLDEVIETISLVLENKESDMLIAYVGLYDHYFLMEKNKWRKDIRVATRVKPDVYYAESINGYADMLENSKKLRLMFTVEGKDKQYFVYQQIKSHPEN